jgi:hypothetical protein
MLVHIVLGLLGFAFKGSQVSAADLAGGVDGLITALIFCICSAEH